MLRKSFDLGALPESSIRNLDRIDLGMSIQTRGVQGTNLLEPVPNYIPRDGDKVLDGANNASIVLGRDRPGEIGSGYGAQTGAGTIDIVAGRLSSDIQTTELNLEASRRELLSVDPNLALDASRIYVSQKTDIDENFNLAEGFSGNSRARAGIAIKSDAVRVIGREGVKIVTKVDTHNSQGGGIISIPKIELIAGNGLGGDQEPAVKGTSLTNALREILQKIIDLNQILDSFMTAQMEFNSVIMTHEHPSPVLQCLGTVAEGNPFLINGGNDPVSPQLLNAGIKNAFMQQVSKFDGIQHSLQCVLNSIGTTEIFGPDNPISTNVTIS